MTINHSVKRPGYIRVLMRVLPLIFAALVMMGRVADALVFEFPVAGLDDRNAPVELSARAPRWSGTVATETGGEAYLVFEMSSPDTNWGSQKTKSVVLNVYSGGVHYADIVVFGGGEVLEYSAYAGAPWPGEYEIVVEFDPVNSPAPEGTAHLWSVRLVVAPEGSPKHQVFRNAPLIYLLKGRADNDLPLLLFYSIDRGEAATRLSYQLLFSNEDGGTGLRPPQLVAEWGRSTDIEQVYYAILDDTTGAITQMRYQGEGHGYRDFSGARVNGHPVFRVSTDNGMFDQEGETGVRLGLMPVDYEPAGRPREGIMDEHPWTFRIMNEEVLSEGKAIPGGPPAMLCDARSYVFIDYTVENRNNKRTLEFLVRLKGDRRTYSSDPKMMWAGDANAGLFAGSGTSRTAVRLPVGSRPEDIEAVAARGAEEVDYVVRKLRAFMLDADYTPGPPVADFEGEAFLTPENRTAVFRAVLPDSK